MNTVSSRQVLQENIFAFLELLKEPTTELKHKTVELIVHREVIQVNRWRCDYLRRCHSCLIWGRDDNRNCISWRNLRLYALTRCLSEPPETPTLGLSSLRVTPWQGRDVTWRTQATVTNGRGNRIQRSHRRHITHRHSESNWVKLKLWCGWKWQQLTYFGGGLD